MKKQVIVLGITSLLTLGTTNAISEPLRAVIGLNNSQVTENTRTSSDLSLNPISGSLLPLDKNFHPLIQSIQSNFPNWSKALGQTVQVDSKQRDLSYSGKLTKINASHLTFTLDIDGHKTQLPINDFYLIPQQKNPSDSSTPGAKKDSYRGKISYQSNQLSWSPKRVLIINKDHISIINMANIENRSTNTITLKNSLLHYAHSKTPLFKTERNTTLMMNASTDRHVDYSDSEITYPIKEITLPPNTHLLTQISKETVSIDKSISEATVYSASVADTTELQFQNSLTFTLKQASLPGSYQTYWQRDGLLIPSDSVSIPLARAKQTLHITTNNNLDMTGQLTLVHASSRKLPATQKWKLTLKNHSNEPRSFLLTQHTRGVINSVEDESPSAGEIKKHSANSVQLTGTLTANESKTIFYTVKINE
ncbi:hypothetical protein MSP8887_01649 [Marinomonas spartinae]|uniref:hypothetical protein n=1 Tax=Marinomonas spartinae TaxID=1792290 RepID=UPI0008090E0F|nr:hypothetical protein [Marinomonas spartinae]SBS32131.1 hypothetical protein MSP8887_01649 [Marinomonas spartinae]